MILFDASNPICFYCDNKLSCLDGEIHRLYANGLSREEISKKLNIYMYTVAKSLLDKQKYDCSDCGENVIIDRLGTIISCRDLQFVMREQECIIIHSGSKLSVPSFKVNFSSKEKLYNKLKSYIIFS